MRIQTRGGGGLRTNVEKLLRRYSGARVITGYTAQYAVRLHELRRTRTLGASQPRRSGIGVYWGPSQHGPKFLERPAREMYNQGEFRRLVLAMLRRGADTLEALKACGMKLQAESQKRVPVEFGVLRASAFTRVLSS